MKKTIVFDIDGTLADLTHRLHYVTDKSNKNWQEFLSRVKDDLPIEQTILINALFSKLSVFDIVLSSGRSENERLDTEWWLDKYGVVYDKLYMRPAGDSRPDYIVKREMLDEMRKDGREPWLVIDDRQTVVDMWRKEGLFVLQCDPNRAECGTAVYEFHPSLTYPLLIMVGPSGAGKSTYLKNSIELSKTQLHSAVISSDAIRDMLTGDFQNQTQNDRVFQTMHELAQTRLKLGLPVVLDATHIRTADRVKAAKLVSEDVKVAYVVVDRSLEDKRKTAGWREGVMVKDTPLIDYHHNIMQSNIKAILNGDGLPNVTVLDARKL